MKFVKYLIIFLLILGVGLIMAYSEYGAPTEFGNETTTTCYVGGDYGEVNCTDNATFLNYLNASGAVEWIKPEHIFDVDKADIENDINTFVDIAGDTMTGDLQMSGNNINGSGNFTTAGVIVGIWQGTDVAVAHGGTGASTAGNARTNLGLGTSALINFATLRLSSGTNPQLELWNGAGYVGLYINPGKDFYITVSDGTGRIKFNNNVSVLKYLGIGKWPTVPLDVVGAIASTGNITTESYFIGDGSLLHSVNFTEADTIFLNENASLWTEALNKYNVTYDAWAYNQTTGAISIGQATFLNLSGTNANQNLDIGIYNLTTTGILRALTKVTSLSLEKLLDPGFDDAGEWTEGNNWEITGSQAVKSAGASGTLVEANPFAVKSGAKYTIEVDIEDFAIPDNLGISMGGASKTSGWLNGLNRFVLTTTDTTSMEMSSGFLAGLKLNNLSIKEMGSASFGATDFFGPTRFLGGDTTLTDTTIDGELTINGVSYADAIVATGTTDTRNVPVPGWGFTFNTGDPGTVDNPNSIAGDFKINFGISQPLARKARVRISEGDLWLSNNSAKIMIGEGHYFNITHDGTNPLFEYSGIATFKGDLNVTGKIYNSMAHVFGLATIVHTVAVVDTWYNITMNRSHADNHLFALSLDNVTIIVPHDGHYTINFGMGIMDSDASPSAHVAMRVELNGAELPGSYVEYDTHKQATDFWLEHITHTDLSEDDEIRLQYISSADTVTISQEDTYATQGFSAFGYIQEVMR